VRDRSAYVVVDDEAGMRVARVFAVVDGQPAGEALSTTALTERESRLLLEGGSKWVGKPERAPSERPFIEALHVRNFRCVQDVTLQLTPLHALIGPNDSGKSSLLAALEAFAARTQQTAVVSVTSGAFTMRAHLGAYVLTSVEAPTFALSDPRWASERVMPLISRARLVRLDPDELRKPSSLIAHGDPIEYDARGRGLAAVYDALLSRKLQTFLEISERFTQLFPTTKAIQLTNATQSTKALAVELHDGRLVDAAGLSEGMLYWLAFAALPHLAPTPLILVEEPENGLHPSRIAEVVRVLRDISRTAQIILATHNPLVINELQHDEVTIITRTIERGTIATPIAQTKNFEQRAKIYALGELWLSYADGEAETELVGEPAAPAISVG
jgi:ABC-type multidrug transport system ATPase subunit